MDGAVAITSYDPEIVVHSLKSENEKEKKEEDTTPTNRKFMICCCCFNIRGENNDKNHVSPSQKSSDTEQNRQAECGCITEAKSFLSSAVYFIFVVVVTFCVFIVLFVELLIDVGLYSNDEGSSNLQLERVSIALHWFAFAVLAGFFVEVITRGLSWRFAMLQDCLSVFDAIVVVIAFLSNLCATLIVGPNSPIDSISLIIILRLVRIQSLIKAKVDFKTAKLKSSNAKIEDNLLSANCTISSLHRRIQEKEYEIRQLQAHLGNEESRQALHSLHRTTNKQRPAGAVANEDLQMEIAIALSKKSFEENSGGIVNKAFSHKYYEEERDMTILVHNTTAENDSLEYDVKDDHKVVSYMDEYFSKSDTSDQEKPDKFSSGAIPKKRTLNLPVQANINGNNNSQMLGPPQTSDLRVLQVESRTTEPISVCIDPAILICESPISNADDRPSWEADASCQVPSQDCPSKTSDVGSSDECNHETSLDVDSSVAKHPNMALKDWPNKSGSFISYESGYLSEDCKGKKRLETVPANSDTNGTERETTAV